MSRKTTDAHAPPVLTCEECGLSSDEEAQGWIALLAESVDLLEPINVVAFCPECARVEFGYGWGREEDAGLGLAPQARGE